MCEPSRACDEVAQRSRDRAREETGHDEREAGGDDARDEQRWQQSPQRGVLEKRQLGQGAEGLKAGSVVHSLASPSGLTRTVAS